MLPDRSVLIGQKLVENAKIEKCDILGDFQTLCLCAIKWPKFHCFHAELRCEAQFLHPHPPRPSCIPDQGSYERRHRGQHQWHDEEQLLRHCLWHERRLRDLGVARGSVRFRLTLPDGVECDRNDLG